MGKVRMGGQEGMLSGPQQADGWGRGLLSEQRAHVRNRNEKSGWIYGL